MIVAQGEYVYEIRDQGSPIAVETVRLSADLLSGMRRSSSGNLYEVEARLDAGAIVQSIRLRYVRGPFSRTATYEAAADVLRGTITALGGRNTLEVKLGRFREVDAGLTVFKALLIAHVRARGQNRWTARVAVIDPATLVAKSIKQSLYRVEAEPGKWLFEPAIGERETIVVDEAGRVLTHVTHGGVAAQLLPK